MISLALQLFLAITSTGTKSPPPYVNRLDRCAGASAAIQTPCTLPVRFSPDASKALIGERDSVWWVVGDRLSLIARVGEEGWTALCCAIQTPLEPIGETELAGITVRVPHMRRAILDVTHLAERMPPPTDIRGPDAPPPPPKADPLRGVITSVSVDSTMLGEKRRINIYVPPDVVAGQQLPVIYLADGNTASFAPIAEAAMVAGRAAPAMIVGIESGQGPVEGCPQKPCDRRMVEYLLDANPAGPQTDTPFGRHLRFVTDELIPYIEKDYPASPRREDRVTAGYSNGGAWALAAAEARPDLFGKVLAMSSGSKAAAEYAGQLKDAQLYAGAGLFEPGFLRRTERAVEVARAAGAKAVMRTMIAGHSRSMWHILFVDGVAWLLPPGT